MAFDGITTAAVVRELSDSLTGGGISRIVQTEQDDTMSRVALLCQENRWREAVLLCKQSLAEAEEKGESDLVLPLQMALPKLEYSLRRQMVAALVNGMKNMKME